MEAGAGQSIRPMQPVEILSPFTSGGIAEQADEDGCREAHRMIGGARAATSAPATVETQAVESCMLPALRVEEAGGRGPLRVEEEEAGDLQPLLLPQAEEGGVLQPLQAGGGCTVDRDPDAAGVGVVTEPGQHPAGSQSDAVQSGAMRDVQLGAPAEEQLAEAPTDPQPDAGAMTDVQPEAPAGPQLDAGRSPGGQPGADVALEVEAALHGAPATELDAERSPGGRRPGAPYEVAASALLGAPAARSGTADEASSGRGGAAAAAAEGAATDGQRLSQVEGAAARLRPGDHACEDEGLQLQLTLLPPASDQQQQQGVRMTPSEGAEADGPRPDGVCEDDDMMELQLSAGLMPSASDHHQVVRTPTPTPQWGIGMTMLPDLAGQSLPEADALPQPDQHSPAAHGGAPPHETAAKEHMLPAVGSGVDLKGCEGEAEEGEGEEEEGVHSGISGARAAQLGSLNHPDSIPDGETLNPDTGGSGAGCPASLQQQPGSLNPDLAGGSHPVSLLPNQGGSHPGSLNPDLGGSESQRGGTLPDSYSGCLPELRREANRIHKGGWAGGEGRAGQGEVS